MPEESHWAAASSAPLRGLPGATSRPRRLTGLTHLTCGAAARASEGLEAENDAGGDSRNLLKSSVSGRAASARQGGSKSGSAQPTSTSPLPSPRFSTVVENSTENSFSHAGSTVQRQARPPLCMTHKPFNYNKLHFPPSIRRGYRHVTATRATPPRDQGVSTGDRLWYGVPVAPLAHRSGNGRRRSGSRPARRRSVRLRFDRKTVPRTVRSFLHACSKRLHTCL